MTSHEMFKTNFEKYETKMFHISLFSNGIIF